jgi:MFS family permease
MFRALKNHNYRLYWSGQVVSVTGMWIQRIAQSWLVLQMTDSPLALGMISTVQFAPVLFFGLVGGVFADRLPKLRVVLTTQAIMAVQALVFAVLVATDAINLVEVFVLSGVLGVANALDQPTRQSFIAELVGPDDLSNAVALNSIQFNVARIAGPALGGVAIAVIGVAGCLALNALSFVAVIGALLRMRPALFYTAPARPRGNVRSQLFDGMRFAVKTREAALIVLVLAVVGTFGYNFTVMLPLIARYSLQSGPSGFGVLTSVMGIGAVAAGLGVAYTGTPSRKRFLLGASGVATLLIGLGLARTWWFAVPLVTALGVASVVFTTTANTRLQLIAPPEMRGRIMSIYQLLIAGTTPLGGAVFGLLANQLGVGSAIVAMGTLCGVGVAAGLAYARFGGPPGMRRLGPDSIAGAVSAHAEILGAGKQAGGD